MELKSKDLLESVKEKIAAEVVQSLEEGEREKILAVGIAQVIGNWDFTHSVEKAVLEIALANVREHLKDPEVRERIRQKAILATEQFIGVLDKALLSVLLELLDQDKTDEFAKPKIYKRIRELLKIN